MPKIVKKRLADGSIKEYRYDDAPKARTVGAVVLEYQRSSDFRKLSSNTKRLRIRYMDAILSGFRDTDITAIKRRHAMQTMDAYSDTPAAANALLQCWRVLMGFALDREYIEFSPITRIKAYQVGTHRRWSDAEIAFAMTALPEPMRRALVVALWTGQREGDCLSMRWSGYDGQTIRVSQQKTGAKLTIPCHADLRAELDSWPRLAVTILTNAGGRPHKVTTFQSYFSKLVSQHPELSGCVFHGLRKTAAAKLAEAGCSTQEIMSITGHRTLAMVEHYTREADQEIRANAAILKLSAGRKKSKSTA